MKAEDHTRRPCGCGACLQAGVANRPQVRDERTGEWAHGYALKAYWESADRVLDQVKRLAARKAMK
jgi:hypothetical protein